MEHTGHVMLVGEGAERFAVAMGFPRENLLTDHSRKIWLLWKEFNSTEDWWGPGLADPHWQPPAEKPQMRASSGIVAERIRRLEERAADLGIEPEFQTSCGPQRSVSSHGDDPLLRAEREGRDVRHAPPPAAWPSNSPGRCGDSPIIGAGCYTDQDVGSAGATGSGEENIKVAGAHTIVENMRHGMSPQEAGMDALETHRAQLQRRHEQDSASWT